jgi:phage baseplate assembly protein gpV
MAGASRGTYFLPEVDDQVLVVFEHGDMSRPIVIGGLWSNEQRPPQTNDDGKNNIKVIKSKSGHRIIFDDTEGSERLVVVDSTGKNKIVLDAANDSLTIDSAGDIELKAMSGKVMVHGKTVKMTSKMGITGQGKSLSCSGQTMNVNGSGMLSLSGGSVMLNPGGGGSPVSVTASVLSAAAAVGRVIDQIRDQVDNATAAAGSAAQRAEALARQMLPDMPLPTAVVGASAAVAMVVVGHPLHVHAHVDGRADAHYEMVDAETGEVIDSGHAPVHGGRATASPNTNRLDHHPNTSSVQVNIHAGGQTTGTRPLPVDGRPQASGSPSPSNALADPRQPMPRTADHRGGAPGIERPGAAPPTRAPVGAAPTVDHRGRAMDAPGTAPVADHRAGAGAVPGGPAAAGGAAAVPGGAAAAGGTAPGGVADHRGATAGASGAAAGGAAAADHRGGAAAGAASGGVADHRASASASRVASDPASAPDAAGSAGGSGHMRVGTAGVAVMEGDGAGAAGAIGGSQVGAAFAGDAGGAAGGGQTGALVEGDVRGAAVAGGHVDSRVAGIHSTDDAERQVNMEAEAQGKERSGYNQVESEKNRAEGTVRGEERDLRAQADVKGQAQARVDAETSPARDRQYEVERERRDLENKADVEGQARAEVGTREGHARGEVGRAERVKDRPQDEVSNQRYQAEAKTGEARDPERAAETRSGRAESRGRSENLGDAERSKGEAESASSDPNRAAKNRIRKLDDE